MDGATTRLAKKISSTVHPIGGDKHRVDDIERIIRPLVEAAEAILNIYDEPMAIYAQLESLCTEIDNLRDALHNTEASDE